MRKRNATLVWACQDHDRSSIQILDRTDSASTLFNKIWFHKVMSGQMSKRLTITKDRYFYDPIDGYKRIIRYKKVK